ncbi:MAG: FG-GAP-like repeat-containing protein [Chthoniobacteraceae bacterium]
MAGGLFASAAVAQQTQYSHGDPTALEQQALELINRARMNPAQEGVILDTVSTWYSIDARTRKPSFFTNLRAEFASYPAVAPLAFNPKLLQSARAHSQDMIARNFFSHVNPNGQDPTVRAAALGYDVGVGENIDGGGATTEDDIFESHFGFMVDYDDVDTSNPLGHRKNILDSSYTETGIGVAGGRNGGRITQDFGGPARSYILGVVYADANSSGSYDVGEGLAGVTVKPDTGNWCAVTSTSGGFAIPIDPVQTVSDTVNVPFPVQGSAWSSVQPYDTAYRQQQIAAAPSITVNLTWSGGALAAPKTTSITMKKPVLRNYRITGTDGWYYTMSLVTAQNVKADFTPTPSALAAIIPSAPLRDFNGDGKGDLVFQNTAGQLATWYLNGAGAASGSAMLYSGGLGDWKLKGIADLNGDGNADLVFQNTAGQIVTWFTNGRGVVTGSAWIYSGGLGDWKVVAVADLNGDGNADIVLQNNAGQIVVWYMNGKGAATGSAWIYSGSLGDWKVVAVVDMNGDGNADIVLQNNAGQIVVWYMNGRGAATGSAWIYSGGLGDWRVR